MSKIINFFVKNFGKYFRFIFYKLNASIGEWINITSLCTWHVDVEVNTIYGSFMKYNPILKIVVGSFSTASVVGNQSKLVDLPSSVSSSHIGLCGIGVCPKTAFCITPRYFQNAIYSSHEEGGSASGLKTYFICFPIA